MAYVLGESDKVDTIIAGSNITLSPASGKGNVTINGSGSAPGVSTGVLSLAYTTGITGSGSNGNITLSNTGVRSLTAGSGLSVNTNTGAITITNTIASGIPSLVAGSNITLTNTSTISVLADPRFTDTMGFIGSGTTSVFTNVSYPYGSPTQYYPYLTNAGTDVLNTIGGRQFWATLTAGSSSVQVMRYRYDGIEAQQGSSGTTIPFLTFNNTTGLFGLSNTSNVVNSNIAGTGISVSGATGSVTITNTGVTSLVAGSNITLTSTLGAFTINSSGSGGVTSLAYTTGINGSASNGAITLSNTGITSLSLTGGSGLYNLGTATAPILGALVIDVLSGTGISVGSSSGNKTVTNTGVTSITAGTGVSVNTSTGAVTVTSTGFLPRTFVFTAQSPYSVAMTTYRQFFALDTFGENTITCSFDTVYPYVVKFSRNGVYHIVWKVDIVTNGQSSDFIGGVRLAKFDLSFAATTVNSTTKYRFKQPNDVNSFSSSAIINVDLGYTLGVGLEVWVDNILADITLPAYVQVSDLSALIIDDCAIQMSIIRLGDYSVPP